MIMACQSEKISLELVGGLWAVSGRLVGGAS